jgi:hypothetical protein
MTERSSSVIGLFDADGLPWTSRLSWGWLLFLSLVTGFVVAILMGIYLGIWIRSKGRSVMPLCVYFTIAAMYAALFLPAPLVPTQGMTDTVIILGVVLWFVGAYMLRNQVMQYYSDREGTSFRISPGLTALLSVWYINGCLRPDFPADKTGKAPKGILKLTV